MVLFDAVGMMAAATFCHNINYKYSELWKHDGSVEFRYKDSWVRVRHYLSKLG